MLILIIIAMITLILGILFLKGRETLQKLSAAMNKVIIEEKPLSEKYSKFLGICLVIFACVLFLIALKVRH